jgi:hypothetical protein
MKTAERVTTNTFAALTELLPSALHRRDRFGVARYGSYITVDTGKYSIAPALAKNIVEELMGYARFKEIGVPTLLGIAYSNLA